MEKIKRILKIDLPPSYSAFLWVARKTVKEYYQILVDTLPGKFVEPYKKRQERQVISKAAKFYLFDVGVAGALSKSHIQEERGEFFGEALEHQSGYDRFTVVIRQTLPDKIYLIIPAVRIVNHRQDF